MAPCRPWGFVTSLWLMNSELSLASHHQKLAADRRDYKRESLSLSLESLPAFAGLRTEEVESDVIMSTVSPSPDEYRLERTRPSANSTHLVVTAKDSRLAESPSATAVSASLLPTKRRITTFVLLLGATSGLAHVLCSLLYEYYANMMTGNTIRWTLALSRQDWNHGLFFGALVLSYCVGASIFRGVDLFFLARPADCEVPSWLSPDEARHKLRTLSVLSPLSVVFFGISDAVNRFLVPLVRRGKGENGIVPLLPQLLRLMTLATSFGMVNAATQDALGQVTNAATGHITRLGVGIADRAVINFLSRRESGDEGRQMDGAQVRIAIVREAAIKTVEATKLSWLFLMALTSSLIFSSAACRRGWIPVNDLEPVMGVVFGVLYATLLAWYTDPFVRSPWKTALRWCQQKTLLLHKLSLQRIDSRENHVRTVKTTRRP